MCGWEVRVKPSLHENSSQSNSTACLNNTTYRGYNFLIVKITFDTELVIFFLVEKKGGYIVVAAYS